MVKIRIRVIFNFLLFCIVLSSIALFILNKNEISKILKNDSIKKVKFKFSEKSNNVLTVINSTAKELTIEFNRNITKSEKEIKVNAFYDDLKKNEFKYMSQNGEDGVIIKLIKIFDLNSHSKRFVEIGAGIGVECNTKHIKDFLRWDGIQFDARNSFPDRGLFQETITHQNVLTVLEKYNLNDFDLFSEDTDFADYWIVEKVLTKHKPKIVIHEVNGKPPNMCVTIKKPLEVFFWDKGDYHGGSVCAFYCLAKLNNYTMIYCESAGVNCFWARNDILESYLKISSNYIQSILNPEFLYQEPNFKYEPMLNAWHEIKC